jgi:dihydrofolate reductase
MDRDQDGYPLGGRRPRTSVCSTIIFAAVSLDGFIAADDDTVGPLFDWYGNGDIEVTFRDEERVFRTTAATADFLRSTAPKIAAVVRGRRLFHLTNGWNGRPANGERAFAVTHKPPTDWAYLDTAPVTFVTDGVRARSSRRGHSPATATSRSPPARSAGRPSARA